MQGGRIISNFLPGISVIWILNGCKGQKKKRSKDRYCLTLNRFFVFYCNPGLDSNQQYYFLFFKSHTTSFTSSSGLIGLNLNRFSNLELSKK